MSGFRTDHFDPAIVELYDAIELAKSLSINTEVLQKLERAFELSKARNEFVLQTTSKESDSLRRVRELTFSTDWEAFNRRGVSNFCVSPTMISGQVIGQFMKSLVSIQKAKRVLEIGFLTGYSALAMAEALPADGELVAIDIADYSKQLGTEFIQSSPHHKKIKLIVGQALDVLKNLAERGEKFDFIYLDADKPEYKDYLKYAFEGGLLSPGGTVAVDNVCWKGEAYDPSIGDTFTKQFARLVSTDPSLHKVLIPLMDGFMIIRKMSDVEGDIA